MMQLSSLWLSYFSIVVVCFAPVVVLHWLLVARGMSYRASIWAQKALSIALLLVPAAIFIALSPKFSVGEVAPVDRQSQTAFSVTKSVIPKANATELASHNGVSMADVWYPFVGMLWLGTLLGVFLFIARVFMQELSLRGWQHVKFVEAGSGVRIFTGSEIKVPFSIGVWRKRVFLPEGLQGQELEIIRSHELNHCHLNHHAWSLLEALQTHLFWFNPLAHVLRKTGNLLREIECDEYSTRTTDRFTYSKVLIETAEQYAMAGMMPIRGQGWNHTGGLRMRLNNLLEQKRVQKIGIWIGSFVSVIALSTVGAFYFATRIDMATELSLLNDVKTQYQQITQSEATIEISKVPQHFIQALLLHEDEAFFRHDGVSFKAIFRATGSNVKTLLTDGPARLHGGATLTQQLAKQFLNDKERSIGRKLREYKLAQVLESNFSKDQILEMYLNVVYFGNQNTGLARAAEYYFKSSYDQLSIEQSAMLIPFLDAPAKYNMIANPKIAEQRKISLLVKLAQHSN